MTFLLNEAGGHLDDQALNPLLDETGYAAPAGAPQVNDWVATAAPQPGDLNTYIRDAFNVMGSPPRLRAVQSAVQTIPPGPPTPVNFQNIIEDNYVGWGTNLFSGISPFTMGNGWTAPIAGWYQVTLTVPLAQGGGIDACAALSYVLNGLPIGPFQLGQTLYAGALASWNCFDQVYLGAGDSVFPWVYSNPGSSTTITNPAGFEIVWYSL